MKTAFTMIELIFVIVILGVLSAIAIPKLNATRDDAELAKAKTNLTTLLGDIQTYYASKGSIPSKDFNLQNLTTVSLYHNSKGNPAQSINAAWLGVKNEYECLYVEVNRGKEDWENEFIGFKIKNNLNQNSLCAKFINDIKDLSIFQDTYKKRDGNRYALKSNEFNDDVMYVRLSGGKVVW